jgi:predicted MPP superfamily phosphohydrolase
MIASFLHLSDLHYRLNWDEDQGLVLGAFFKDLTKQVEKFKKEKLYLVFSGDMVKAGSNPQLYDAFQLEFDTALNKIGIYKDKRICIPGNHDVSQAFVAEHKVEHAGILSQSLNESDFNDYVQKSPPLLVDKFSSYKDFQDKFCDYGLTAPTLAGNGWEIIDQIGVYCLNSALCSSGGFEDINDRGKLSVDTRTLQRWIRNSKSSLKILVMHHPLDWLTEWSRIEVNKLLQNGFCLCLSGHLHDQAAYYTYHSDSVLVNCSAPPLLTNKKGELGYAIITVASSGVSEIQYRQWTKNNSFVTGVNFSNTDDGKIVIKQTIKLQEKKGNPGDILYKRLEKALTFFSTQPSLWVEPIICKTNKIGDSYDRKAEDIVPVSSIVSNPESLIIMSPPQFGLTCLSHYLIKKAWELHSANWLYLDATTFKSHNINRAVREEMELRNLERGDISCVVLDSWTNLEKESIKLLKGISELFSDLPVIVMQTIDDLKFVEQDSDGEVIQRQFQIRHLLALPRSQVRRLVNQYNLSKYIGDDDSVLNKVLLDIDTLNIHRTAFNCLTLLKVSEKYFDESPVNRTKMLEMVLFLLFTTEEIPTYKSMPDVKDCEYVLGYFCQRMMRKNIYYFTRQEFLAELGQFCREKLISLEVEIVFDILYDNNIIIQRANQYYFRSSYWIYYFAAHSMHQDADFAKYMFSENRYASFPEVIEFYTGIDRRREDALAVLLRDLKESSKTVETKVGLPGDMNPYQFEKWAPTPATIEKMRTSIANDVLNSNLPDVVKDKYADRIYNPLKPYVQTIGTIFREYSLVLLFRNLKAASRGLRNSDYVDPAIKKELLAEILQGWEQVCNVMVALAPVLASQGQAAFEGQSFTLSSSFGALSPELEGAILRAVPINIIRWFGKDLFSNKMAPLLYDYINGAKSELRRHEIALLLITERPKDWKKQVENYMVSISKNSFYLLNVYTHLKNEYEFGFISRQTHLEIEYLIKMGFAKHEFGDTKPGLDKIRKVVVKGFEKKADDDIDDQ